jgi:hypothetical protein
MWAAMSEEIRSLNMQNMPSVISLINETARGTSLEGGIDFLGFMLLTRYWNFSFNHSLLYYENNEPAAITIHCADPLSHEAYTFYWGTLPRFRNLRIALKLAEACAQKLRADGYVTVYGDSLPERPVRRWRFVHFLPKYLLHGMQAQSPNLPASDQRYVVREVGIRVLSEFPFAPDEPFHWCQRPTFLSNAEPFHTFIGAFSGNELKGYAIVLSKSACTTLIDLRSLDPDPAIGCELLRFILENNYRPPFKATYIFDQSYCHRLLVAAGFADFREFTLLSRDLLTST